MTIAVPAYPPTDLVALIRRIGIGDRSALRILHAGLREPVSDWTRRALSRPEDVQAIVDATFVEVYWMSRYHATTEVDVLAWVFQIAAQRVTERLRRPDPQLRPCHHDEDRRLALRWLLDPGHPGDPGMHWGPLP